MTIISICSKVVEIDFGQPQAIAKSNQPTNRPTTDHDAATNQKRNEFRFHQWWNQDGWLLLAADFDKLESKTSDDVKLELLLLKINWLNFFGVLVCHWPVLDGFDQHFQATVRSPLTSAVD